MSKKMSQPIATDISMVIAYVYECIYAPVHMHVYVCIRVYMCVRVYVCVYVYVCVCVYIYMYLCIKLPTDNIN